MPVPLVPYPPQPMPPPPPLQGQSQLICGGCRSLLVYPHGATNVRCALCSSVTPVPPPGAEMAQLFCGGCRTLLMYVRGATSVRCSCCHTINIAMEANQMAHINCGGCNTTLMYAFGAQSVKCALCQFVTTTPINARAPPLPNSQRLMAAPSTQPGTTSEAPSSARHQSQTVVVENPMTMDESGKLVSSVAVGVTTKK